MALNSSEEISRCGSFATATASLLLVSSHMKGVFQSPRSKIECVGADVYSCDGENLVVGRLETGGSCLIQGQCPSKCGVRRIESDSGIGILWRFGSVYETYSGSVKK